MQSTKSFTLTGVMSSQSDFDKINEMYLWSYDHYNHYNLWFVLPLYYITFFHCLV